jgi:hypothetical protein
MPFWGNRNGKQATYFTMKLQISFMTCYCQRSFFNEGLDAINDGLGIEVTIESLIEACLEVEEKEHQLASL